MNSYRALHGSGKLLIHKNISQEAQEHANKLCRGISERYIPFDVPDMLSNLTCHSSRPLECVHMWYEERKYYNYENGQYVPKAAHFTLLIWKSSKYVGVGICSKPMEKYFVVAKLYPRGNEKNKFSENVLPQRNHCSNLPTNCIFSAVAVIIPLFA
ncbi:Golgi-associated plant pathogenesis-related protein 1 isoform X1 [Drosophila hydei]|nr:Golgi-associated plant pathogenesis-related protein 1 isoform X1 [Drosophila hydei]